METEQGIITAVLYNRSRTVAKLRIGAKKWVYVKTTNNLNDLLGANMIFTGEWHSTVKGKYFLAENMDVHRHPSVGKTMDKVVRLLEKKKVKYPPLLLEYHPLISMVLSTLYLMGRKQAIIDFMKMPARKQELYAANPYQFYLNKRLDYYSAETLSQITMTPLDNESRIIAQAQHVVTMAHGDGRECVPIRKIAETINKQINMSVEEIEAALKNVTADGGVAGLRRVEENLMLGWIYWLREKAVRLMFNNPLMDVPERAKNDEHLSRLLSRKINILHGGAGTGKTTLLKKLRDSGLRVMYSALTGKAASVLGGDAQTVHSMLGYRKGKFTVERLDCDLVVVDETSMITWHSLYALLKASPRIIFSGDPAQLPPVEGEAVFLKMLALLPKVELTKAWRFEGSAGPDIQQIRFPSANKLLAAVKQMAVMLSRQGSVQVITPVNTGMLGVGHINSMLRPIFNSANKDELIGRFHFNDMVMVTRNVYVDGTIIAANGQVGTITGQEDGMLWVRINGGRVLIEDNALTYAYCQTVHKVQGGQFKNVIFIIPDGLDREFLTENLLLVGKTRGSKKTYVLTLAGSATPEPPFAQAM